MCHGVAGATRKDRHRHTGANQTIGNLHLSPVTTVPGDEIGARLDCLTGVTGGIARGTGDAEIPVDIVLPEDAVDDIQNRFILTGGRVDDHVNFFIRKGQNKSSQ